MLCKTLIKEIVHFHCDSNYTVASQLFGTVRPQPFAGGWYLLTESVVTISDGQVPLITQSFGYGD